MLAAPLDRSWDDSATAAGAPTVICTYTGAVSGNAYTVTGFYPAAD